MALRRNSSFLRFRAAARNTRARFVPGFQNSGIDHQPPHHVSYPRRLFLESFGAQRICGIEARRHRHLGHHGLPFPHVIRVPADRNVINKFYKSIYGHISDPPFIYLFSVILYRFKAEKA